MMANMQAAWRSGTFLAKVNRIICEETNGRNSMCATRVIASFLSRVLDAIHLQPVAGAAPQAGNFFKSLCVISSD